MGPCDDTDRTNPTTIRPLCRFAGYKQSGNSLRCHEDSVRRHPRQHRCWDASNLARGIVKSALGDIPVLCYSDPHFESINPAAANVASGYNVVGSIIGKDFDQWYCGTEYRFQKDLKHCGIPLSSIRYLHANTLSNIDKYPSGSPLSLTLIIGYTRTNPSERYLDLEAVRPSTLLMQVVDFVWWLALLKHLVHRRGAS